MIAGTMYTPSIYIPTTQPSSLPEFSGPSLFYHTLISRSYQSPGRNLLLDDVTDLSVMGRMTKRIVLCDRAFVVMARVT